MTVTQIQNLSNWMIQKTQEISFGHVTITLKVHEGQITLIEKNIRETEQPSKAGATYEKRNSRK